MDNAQEIKLIDFTGGMSDATREQVQGMYSYSENFDNRSEKGVLIPRPLLVKDGGSYITTDNMKVFDADAAGSIWALGNQRVDHLTGPFTGSPLWVQDVFGFDGSLHDSNPEAGIVVYKNTIYWLVNNKTFQTYISPTFNNSFASFANTITVTSRIFLGKDSNFYMGYKDNGGLTKLCRLTPAGVLTEGVLTLPNDMTINSLAWHGNYLAIGCHPDVQTRQSTIYLWDYSQPDVQETIQVGQSKLRGMATLEDSLLLVFQRQTTNELDFDFYPRSSITFEKFIPQDSSTPFVFVSPNSISTASIRIRVYNKCAYFPVQYTFDTGSHLSYKYGIAKIGRDKIGDPYSLTIDGILGTETGEITDCLYFGSSITGQDGLIYATYTDSTHTSIFTSAASNNFATAKIETLIYSSKSPHLVKKLQGVCVTYKPLPSAGQVVLKYRKNEETAWTTIFTDTTDNAISHEANGIESDNSSLPDFKEIQFQIISTGGAVVTGLKFKFTPETNIYGQ